MPDLKDLNNLYLIAAFVVPGLIVTYVRSQFITGRMDKISDAVLGYFVLTIIYYGITLPFIGCILNFEQGVAKTLLWWVLIIAGPAFFGLTLGISAQYGLLRWIAQRLRLRIVHGTPTSWDWRFSVCQNNRLVMVTLTDGSSIAGIFGSNSFASSDPGERDLYLEEVCDVDPEGIWAYRSEKSGILISAKEIRSVQFWE